MEQEHDLTQGSLVKTVVVFAIPFLLANLIQAFYGAADLMVVGWYCEGMRWRLFLRAHR